MPEGIFLIWTGYIMLRLSIHPKIKADKNESISTLRVLGIIMCCIGVVMVFYYFGWLSKTIIQKGSIWFWVLMVCVLIWMTYLDKKKGIAICQIKPRKWAWSLLTWDIWLISVLCLFFLIYYPLSIRLSIG